MEKRNDDGQSKPLYKVIYVYEYTQHCVPYVVRYAR